MPLPCRIKWGDSEGEEDVKAMNEEKKVKFEVGDYVQIDSGKLDTDNCLVYCCGRLGIIVGQVQTPDYNYWRVYFFALKCTYTVDEKYLAKPKYDYEVRVKPEGEYIENDINVTKQVLNSYYGEYPVFIGSRRNGKALTSLKEMCKTYLESDGAGFKSALDFLYGCSMETGKLPKIKKVIFNGPATIVLWADGDKTVVQCVEGDTMDKEKGLAMAICKKALGRSKTHYDYYNVFK